VIRNDVSQVAGRMIKSAGTLAALFALYLFITFKFIGGETVQDIQSQRTGLLVIAIVVALVAAIRGKLLAKDGAKYAGLGIVILPFVSLVAVAVYFVFTFNFYTPFDQVAWRDSERKPLKMAASLVTDNQLIGFTRKEVKLMLGQGIEQNRMDTTAGGGIHYLVEDQWTLNIVFEQGFVKFTTLRLPWMMSLILAPYSGNTTRRFRA
jgi:hypothetical protein